MGGLDQRDVSPCINPGSPSPLPPLVLLEELSRLPRLLLRRLLRLGRRRLPLHVHGPARRVNKVS